MRSSWSKSLAVIAGFGVAASALALAAPASADGRSTSLSAGDGTVGVNQVLTGTYVFPNGLDNPTCWDPGAGVTFDFQLSDGTDLGSAGATCSDTSTWTATVNWVPSSPGRTTITANATQQLLGGTTTLGSASRKVNIAGVKPSGAPSTVRGLQGTGVSTNAVSLNWSAPSSDGGSPISGYIVKWAGPTSGQFVAQATNANVGGLAAGSAYTFSVSAANAFGWSQWVSVSQRTANSPTPAPHPVTQQVLVGPSWTGGGPKVKSGMWRTFNNSQNLDTNAGHEARLSATNKSSVSSVSFQYVGDQVQVRAVLKPGAKRGSFTLLEYSPAVPGFTAMGVTRTIKVVK